MTFTVTKERIALGILFAIAILERFLAFSQPYHQDEYKWAIEVNPATGLSNLVHPPFADYMYRIAGLIVGFAHLRIVPIVLSLVTLGLLFYFARRWWGGATALLIAGVYTIDFFALLASVQIDIDGAFLPLAALLAFAAYIEYLRAHDARMKKRWLGLLAASLVIGFTIKLSFVLVPVAIFAHAVWEHPRSVRAFFSRKEVLLAVIAAAVVIVVALALVWSRVPFLAYVDKFIGFRGRDLGELAFLTVKGVIYLSPLIAFGLVLGLRHLRALSLWFIFLAANILFYFVAFDFTHTSFDRYLMFLVLPGSIITGFALRALVPLWNRMFLWGALLCTFVVLLVTHVIFSMPHYIVPLIPKSAFVEAFLSGKWNFLLPMTGGSGPLGFYIPVDAIALLWVLAGAGVIALALPRIRTTGLVLFVAASLVYNAAVSFEYLTGHYFGYAPGVTTELTTFIAASDIPSVITYNDIGAYELMESGKYGARFYPHDEFVASNVQKFATSSGYYLVVEMPQLNADSGYARFFAQCKTLATSTSKLVSGSVLDCRGVSSELITEGNDD